MFPTETHAANQRVQSQCRIDASIQNLTLLVHYIRLLFSAKPSLIQGEFQVLSLHIQLTFPTMSASMPLLPEGLQTLTLPMVTQHYPWSQLLVNGDKDEVRHRRLTDSRMYASPHQDVFVVETNMQGGGRAADHALLDDASPLPKPLKKQCIVGVVRYSHDEEYTNWDAYDADRSRHRIRATSLKYEASFQKKVYVWRKVATYRCREPVPTDAPPLQGGCNPRTYTVDLIRTFPKPDDAAAASGSAAAEGVVGASADSQAIRGDEEAADEATNCVRSRGTKRKARCDPANEI